MSKNTKFKNKKAFTLIELLVVVAIISLLSSVVLASLNSARSKARDAKRKEDLHSIQIALEMYYNDYGSYPNPGNCSGTPCFLSSWNGWTTMLPKNYIGSVPIDPTNNDNGNACGAQDGSHLYDYYTDTSSQHYVLATSMENISTSDPNYFTGTIGCSNFANWAIRNGL